MAGPLSNRDSFRDLARYMPKGFTPARWNALLASLWFRWDALQDKGGAVYNVLAYGADSRGVVDSTTAFKQALSDGAGATVLIPFGTFKITAELAITTGTTIVGYGYGSNVNATVTGTVFGGSSATDITFQNFRLSGTFVRGIGFSTASRVRISGCEITGATATDASPTSAIYFLNGTDILINENYLHANGQGVGTAGSDVYFGGTQSTQVKIIRNVLNSPDTAYGCLIFDCSYPIIVDNYINTVTGNGGANGYGVCLYDTTADATHCHDAVICGNQISNTTGNGIYLQGSYRDVVSGNILINTGSNMPDTTLPVGAIAINAINPHLGSCAITGNTIKTSGKAGITWTSTNTVVSGNYVEGTAKAGIMPRGAADNSTIEGNTVYNCAGGILSYSSAAIKNLTILGNAIDTTTGTTSGIGLANLTGSSIVGNNVFLAAGWPLLIQGGEKNVIASNTVLDGGTSTANGFDGIRVETTYSAVVGNVSTNTTTSNQRYGISIQGAGTGIIVIGNMVTGNATGGILLAAPDVVTRALNGGDTSGPLKVVPTAVVTATGNYGLLASDEVLLGNATTVGFNVTLPTAVGIKGRRFLVKKIDASANVVTVVTSGGQTIDGAANVALGAQWARVVVISDGANWIIE